MASRGGELEWLPDGIRLSRDELAAIFTVLRELRRGTKRMDMNRLLVVDMTEILVRAMEREDGGEP